MHAHTDGFMCSTPYGIRGWCRQIPKPRGCAVPRCSTPYGIRGWCRGVPLKAVMNANARAQRLTASEDGAAVDRWRAGIHRHVVLNALRHQRMVQWWARSWVEQGFRCSTPYGIRGWCRRSARKYTRSGFTCAQRLTASEDGAGPIPGAVSQLDLKCSTPYGIRGWCRRPFRWRLNAGPCAQRLTASEDGAAVNGPLVLAMPYECSTPYGIRGWCRAATRGHQAQRTWVLNALRHQRMVQTRWRVSLLSSVLCAQRLTASEDGADDTPPQLTPRAPVLNALRHQRMVQDEIEQWRDVV